MWSVSPKEISILGDNSSIYLKDHSLNKLKRAQIITIWQALLIFLKQSNVWCAPGKYTYHSYSKFYETLIPDVVGIDQHKFRNLGKVRGGHIFPFMCKIAYVIISYYCIAGSRIGVNDQICQPYQPSSVSTSYSGTVRNRSILHGMVLRVSFVLYWHKCSNQILLIERTVHFVKVECLKLKADLCIANSGGSRISPRWGRQHTILPNVPKKLHEIVRIWTWMRGASKILLCGSATG